MSPVFRVQKLGSTGRKLIRMLHRNMLFPFVSLMEEIDDTDPTEEVMGPVEDSVVETHMQTLVVANEFMDHHFDPDYL